MKKGFAIRSIKDIPISRKLFFIVGAMAILIMLELFTLWFAVHTLSSVRALVGAEGLWSKAEKDAVYTLNKYYRTHDEKDYSNFQKFMSVPLGDHKTRLELYKPDMNIDSAREGFIEGRVHPNDIDGMIKLLRRFHSISYIRDAIYYWGQGDSIVGQIMPISEQIKAQINAPVPSQKILDSLLQRVDIINGDLTKLEDNFSFTLGEGSRWLEYLIMKILFCVALTVEITGLSFSILVSRNITKGLNEIIKTADKIKRGDPTVRATVFSKDEIGQVATSINQMAEQLILSNQELSHFAYIASHDLQEPLRKISVFTSMLEEELKATVSEKGKMYMDKIIKSSFRMQQLIEDILQLSRLSTATEQFTQVNLNNITAHVIVDFDTKIIQSNTTINSDVLPTIEANALEMGQLFQNLFSNAIKFNNRSPEITITSEIINGSKMPEKYWATTSYKFAGLTNNQYIEEEKFCRIYFRDNGIGFEEKYLERIFVIFQRLNSKHLYEGSGIGLAVCNKIVSNHHGTISATSVPDQGSTFIITLPVSQSNFNPKTALF